MLKKLHLFRLVLYLTWACDICAKMKCGYIFFPSLHGLSVHSDRGTPPTRQGRRRSGAATTDHESGPLQTGPESPRAGPGPLQVEAGPPGGLSHRASQGTRTQHPIWVGVRSPRKPLWARPPTPGSGAATSPTGPTSGPPPPRLGRVPEPPRAPVGAATDPRVRCRHVSHRHEFSA